MNQDHSPALISVIVPVYKVERFLPACIQSLQAQTHRRLEIILVDDGSPDGCGAICDRYAAADPRIRVIHQENRGVSAARNAGLEIAAGDYIGYVDSDDYIHPQMYRFLLNAMQGGDYPLAMCDKQDVAEDAKAEFALYGSEDVPVGETDRDTLIRQLSQWEDRTQVSWALWNKLYRRDLIQGLLFKDFFEQDLEYNLRAYLRMPAGALAAHVKLPLYCYVQRGNSAVHSINRYRATGILTAAECIRDVEQGHSEFRPLFADMLRKLIDRTRNRVRGTGLTGYCEELIAQVQDTL